MIKLPTIEPYVNRGYDMVRERVKHNTGLRTNAGEERIREHEKRAD
jgi:hypothetical protein